MLNAMNIIDPATGTAQLLVEVDPKAATGEGRWKVQTPAQLKAAAAAEHVREVAEWTAADQARKAEEAARAEAEAVELAAKQ